MASQTQEPARIGRWIAAAVAAGLVLRLVIALAFPEYVTGDAMWYLRIAKVVAHEGILGPDTEKFDRPPLYPLFLSAFVRVFGDDATVPVRIVQAAFTSAGIWFLGGLVRTVLPSRPWIAVAAAWLHALDPWAADFAKALYTENVANPLVLALLWACARSVASPGWRTALLTGALGAVVLHVRFDLAAVVLAAFALCAVSARLRGGAARGTTIKWAAAGAIAVLLCVPWSLHASARRGERMFVAAASGTTGTRACHGWYLFFASVHMPRTDWLAITWWNSWQCADAWVPSRVFDSPEEERRVREIMRRSREAGGPADDDELARIAVERIRRDPVRHWVVNPLLRSASIWLDPTDTDRPSCIPHTRRSMFGRVHGAATLAWVVIGGIGFLGSWWYAFRPRAEPFLLGACVLVRTYSILTAGLVTGGHALYERRYMTCVEPLAQAVAVWTVWEIVERLRRRRA